MISIIQLWLPILCSGVAVFLLSSLVHMLFKWHNSDFKPLANEDEVRAAIRRSNPAAGQYVVPYCADMKAMQASEFQQKYRDGPVGLIVLKTPGVPSMARPLMLWFLYTLAIGFFAGYLAAATLPSGSGFVSVCRLVATVAFLAYVGGSVQSGIWMGKPWRSVAKDFLDSALYAAATGLVFAALWPR